MQLLNQRFLSTFDEELSNNISDVERLLKESERLSYVDPNNFQQPSANSSGPKVEEVD